MHRRGLDRAARLRVARALPGRPPLPRWILQLVGVVVAVPVGVLLAHLVHRWRSTSTPHTSTPQMTGLIVLIVEGLLFAPWIALGAMVRQRDVLARDQALAFALERSQLERNALETRLRLLQAQVEPHFLFNTLANVQELVDAGSPQAPHVLASLIAYLRAAVPRIHEPATTLGAELELVRAYLELMRMRMPDRLEFALHVDPWVNALRMPADDGADARRERRSPRHRSERGRRARRRRSADERRPLLDQRDRYGPRLRAGRRAAWAPASRRCASGCSSHSAARRSSTSPRSSRTAFAPRSTYRRASNRRDDRPADRADRRRRAAASRRARAPAGASVAGARDRRAGAQRPRGDRVVRVAASGRLLPRRANAGQDRRRGREPHRPARARRVRHGVRRVRRRRRSRRACSTTW